MRRNWRFYLRCGRCAILAIALIGASAHALEPPAVGACGPMVEQARALTDVRLPVTGSTRMRWPLRVPNNRALLLLAGEEGVDVTVALEGPSGRELARADSPVRRTGIQRIAFASSGVSYIVELVGKQPPAVHGMVRLRVVDLAEPSISGNCSELERGLATADAAYAAANLLSQGIAQPGSASAPALYRRAAMVYEDAAARARTLDRHLEADCEHAAAAALYQDVQSWDEANAWAVKAAETYRLIAEPYGEARAQAIRAAALMEIGSSAPSVGNTAAGQGEDALRTARRLLRRIAAFHARRHESYDQALALNNIGLAYDLQESFESSLRFYGLALPLFKRGHESYREALTLQNIALVEYELGRMSDASRHYTQALSRVSKRDDPKLFAIISNNIALVDWKRGRPDAALREFEAALGTARQTQDAYEQSISLYGMGSVYASLGDDELSLLFFRQGLASTSEAVDPLGHVAALRAVGNILREHGEARDALSMHRKALALALTSAAKARVQLQIARDEDAMGDGAASLALASTVLRDPTADDALRAGALRERALLRRRAANWDGAESDLKQSVRLAHRADAPTEEFQAWTALAQLLESRGDDPLALEALDHALALAEAVRLESANPELRATLLEPLRPAFDMRISLLAHRYLHGRDSALERDRIAMDALETAERARARALSDLQNMDFSAAGIPPQLARKRQQIYGELGAERARLESVIDRQGPHSQLAEAVRTELALLRAQSDEINAQIAASVVHSGGASGGGRVDLQLERIPEGVAIVEYWLGAQEAFAWVATHDTLTMYRLSPSADITRTALELHEALRGFGTVSRAQRNTCASRLYQMVIAPLGKRVLGQPTIIFAADGALHYVPFAVLSESPDVAGAFLGAHHDVAVAPSITSLLRSAPRPSVEPARRILVVADPVYGRADDRFMSPRTAPLLASRTRSGTPALRGAGSPQTLDRLVGTKLEADAIASLSSGWKLQRLDGFSATRAAFLSADLGAYRIIHVGAHAVTDSEIPGLSALILSTVDRQGAPLDGRVLAADLAEIQLHAAVVILSGCDTALGKSVRGEGLVGLRYAVLARGARAVVASLWQVPDGPTAELMRQFYTALLRRHASAVASLATAMRTLQSEGYSDPALWGAFTVTISDLSS
ncbi:MAG TPA: CHAT domain-containing tetratricopeptide repeat protein [Steroidobacteraceae bacterium]